MTSAHAQAQGIAEAENIFIPPGDELLIDVVDEDDVLIVLDATIKKCVILEDRAFEWRINVNAVTCDPNGHTVGRQFGQNQLVPLNRFQGAKRGDELWLTNEQQGGIGDHVVIVILATEDPTKGIIKVFDNH